MHLISRSQSDSPSKINASPFGERCYTNSHPSFGQVPILSLFFTPHVTLSFSLTHMIIIQFPERDENE